MEIKRRARAKINLSLHVTGQRDDGYHLLDSVVAFAEFGDALTFRLAPSGVTLSTDGPFAPDLGAERDNLILFAARCFDTKKGAEIDLQKHLPVESQEPTKWPGFANRSCVT